MLNFTFEQIFNWLSTDVAQRHITNLSLIMAWGDAISVIIATYSKTIISLRLSLMFNNIFGMLSGLTSGALPTIFKHVINFPLNYIRYKQIKRLIENVNDSNKKEINFEWLKPFMHPIGHYKGDFVFHNEEIADKAYVLVDGEVEILERKVILKSGEIFGELALFTGSGKRTASALCLTNVRLLYISYHDLEQLYFQNPEFGFHLIKLIVRRSEATRLALMHGY
jgi:hypothetical protein